MTSVWRTLQRAAPALVPAFVLCAACTIPKATEGPFLVEPYLQLGSAYTGPGSLALLWHTADQDANWSVELRSGDSWKPMSAPVAQRVAVGDVKPHRVWQATFAGLPAGHEFDYRVLRAGTEVFSARGKAPKAADQASRFVAFGDSGDATPDERAVAAQTLALDPDLVFIAGDIVYTSGRVAEYRSNFYPYYNSAAAPLMRRIPFAAAPGNHDTSKRDLFAIPDTLAFFYYWSQPLNGPLHPSLAGLSGSKASQEAFRAAAGANFPRMANFSFNYGNAHWLVLDSNQYVDWNAPALRAWVARDLAAAKTAWKFVGFHHAPYHSSETHAEDTWMRGLSEVFQKGGVDVVISGHVHNYERSRPLEGIVYLVTGGGGADLYDPEQSDLPSTWQNFTVKFISSVHSLTVVDLDDRTARFRQVSGQGQELDSFILARKKP